MRNVLYACLVAVAAVVWVPAASAWTWPVDGPVVRPFALGDNVYASGQHRGIDIGAVAGAPVRAAAGGQVTFAGTVPRYGKTLTIHTADGYAVTLLHLGSLATVRGAMVAEGETVASVGTAGDAQHPDPYVYLGIRHWADEHGYVDPLLFLPPVSSSAPEVAGAPPAVVAQAPGAAASPVSPPVAAQPPVAAATSAQPPLPSADSAQPLEPQEAGRPAETRPAAHSPREVTVAAVHTRRLPDQTRILRIVGGDRESLNATRSRRRRIPERAMRAAAFIAVGDTRERSPSATILETASRPRVVGESLAASAPAVKAAASTRQHRMVGRPAETRARPERSAQSGGHARRHRELWLLGLLTAALVGGGIGRRRQSRATQPRPSQRHAPCPLGRRMPSAAACGMTHAAIRPSHRCGRSVHVLARSGRLDRRRRRTAAGRTS